MRTRKKRKIWRKTRFAKGPERVREIREDTQIYAPKEEKTAKEEEKK